MVMVSLRYLILMVEIHMVCPILKELVYSEKLTA